MSAQVVEPRGRAVRMSGHEHGPRVRELLSGDLAELSKRYGLPHSTLWNRRETIWNGYRGHADTCVTFCAHEDCPIEHGCWCPIGSLSYAEYLETRPPVVVS